MTEPQPEQASVPVEVYTQVLAQQRNDALDAAAQMKALAMHYRAENERLVEELAKSRAEVSQDN